MTSRIMEAAARKKDRHSVSHGWSMIKSLDNSQKQELMSVLASCLMDYDAESKHTSSQPYSLEELHQMVAQGEQQFAEGLWQESEEMFSELKEDFSRSASCLRRL